MKAKIKKINLSKTYDGCNHPDISVKKTYLVKYNGNKILGKFYKVWYGWNFIWFGSVYAGLQLNHLDEVYEIQFL